MKLNLVHKDIFLSAFSSQEPKTQGLKIREKKLETKYKNLIQKHNTLSKFTITNLDDIDLQESDEKISTHLFTEETKGLPTKQRQYVGLFHIKKKDQREEQNSNKKPYQFLTARNLLENNERSNRLINKKSPKTKQQAQIKAKNQPQPFINSQNPILSKQKYPQLFSFPSLQLHEDLQTQQSIQKLEGQSSCYSNLWQKFLKSVKQISITQEELCLTHVCQKDRKSKLLQNFMKQMDFLLEQHDNLILDTIQKLKDIRENQLKKLYITSHTLHEKHMHAKTAILQHNLEFQQYLSRLKQEQKQRRQMLQSKRESSLKSQSKSRTNSPLRHLHNDININEKDIRQMMEKKSKLNLELDLNFQIQQRKRIAKEKEVFNEKKSKLEKDKASIENKMKQVRQKTEFKEKQTERYEFQKQKYQKEREYFLKMLLKNPDYRLDGVLWTFKKMIEYGHEPHLSDFSHLLDFPAKTFLINEFHLMKKEHIYEFKPQEARRHRVFKSKKEKRPSNRQRVKSVTVSNSEKLNIQNSYYNIDDLNQNLPPNFSDKSFFTFGSKSLLKQPDVNPSIRKKSGSLTMMKTYEESLGQTEQNPSQLDNKRNSFKSLTKENNRKKLYVSAQKYIKNWVSKQGWKVCTSRSIKNAEDHRMKDNFISEEKTRVKQKYFKIGRPNTRYNSIVKTLYGSEGEIKDFTSRRVKTSRQ